jgi:hypothetical protein
MSRLVHAIRRYLPRRRRRSWRYVSPRRRGVGLVLLAIVLALFYGYWYMTNEARIRRLAEQALRDFSNGAAVSIDSARYGMFSPVQLQGVVIRGQTGGEDDAHGPPIQARSIRLWHNPWKLMSTGQLYPTEIVCTGAELRLVWQDSKVVNFAFFAAPRDMPSPEEGPALDMPQPTIRFQNAKVYSYSNTAGIERYQEYGDLTVTAKPMDNGFYHVEFEDRDQVEQGSLDVDPSTGRVHNLNLEGIEPPPYFLPPWLVTRLKDLNFEGKGFHVQALDAGPDKDRYRLSVNGASLNLPPEQGGIELRSVTGSFLVDLKRRELIVEDLTGKLPQARQATFRLRGQYGDFDRGSSLDDPNCFCDMHLELDSVDVGEAADLAGPIGKTLRQIKKRFSPAGTVDVSVDIRREPGGRLQVTGQAGLKDVAAAYRGFPYPLNDLAGTIGFDGSGVRTIDLSAMGGKVSIDGTIDDAEAMELIIEGKDVALDARLREAMGKRFGYVWERLKPRGYAGFLATVRQSPGRTWTLDLDILLTGKAAITYAGFPYPLENLTGKVQIRGDDVRFTGVECHRRGRRLAIIRGRLTDLNNDELYSTRLDLDIERMPIDDTFRNALPAKARRVVESLHAEGMIDTARVQVSDSTAEGLDFTVQATLDGVSLLYDEFPYAIHDAAGQVTVRPDEVILGTGGNERPIIGRHGQAEVALSGRVGYADQTQVKLWVGARNLPFDAQLYRACPEAVQAVWDQFSPEGKAEISLNFQHALSDETVKDYRLAIRPAKMDIQYENFPMPLRGVVGEIIITPEQVDLSKLQAQHEGQFVQIDGRIRSERGRRVGELAVEARDIKVNKELLDALPDEMGPLAKKFRSAGTAGMKIKRLRFEAVEPSEAQEAVAGVRVSAPEPGGDASAADGRDAPPEAEQIAKLAWSAEGIFSVQNVTMDLGLESKNITGSLAGKVSSAQEGLGIEGELRLDNVEVGPRKLTDLRGNVVKSPKGNLIIFDKLRGRVHEGKLAGFAEIRLAKQIEYGLSLEFERVDLDSLFNAGVEKSDDRVDVQGNLAGRVSLVARAGQENLKAEGQILIDKAKLYKLPVLLGFLHVVYVTLPTDSAFTEASVQYEIRKGKLVFGEIRLNGNALSLVGSGNMVLKNDRLDLTFVAGPPGKLPSFGKVADEIANFVAKGLHVVKVTGTIHKPNIRSVPLRGLQKIVETILAPAREDPG